MALCVIADGEFGLRVARVIVRLLAAEGRTALVAADGDGHGRAEILATASFAIRASWRDVRQEFESFAEAAAQSRVSWLPVAIAHPYVRVGPAIVPGTPPCYACYSRRAGQHQRDPRSEQVEAGYARDTALGVSGHPPHLAALVAGQALALVSTGQAHDETGRRGEVRMVDSRTDHVESCVAVPANGCPACDPAPALDRRARAGRDRLRGLAARTAGPAAAS